MLMMDSRLELSSSFVIYLDLCQVRLSDNAAFPWVILIPKREGVCEIIDLDSDDQHRLMQEIAITSHIMKQLFHPHKLNIASLGNVVSQLHIHIIARYQSDQAWPNPVWNTVSETYDSLSQGALIEKLKQAFLTTL